MIAVVHILRKFGVTRCYKGYDQAVSCITLAVENDFRLTAVTKDLYMVTAEKYKCRWTAVERNMRTVVTRAWHTDAELLCNIAGYPLHREPTVSEFIEIIAYHVRGMEQAANKTQALPAELTEA